MIEDGDYNIDYIIFLKKQNKLPNFTHATKVTYIKSFNTMFLYTKFKKILLDFYYDLL